MSVFKKIVYSTSLLVALAAANAVSASSEAHHPKQVQWVFDGPLGTFDRQSIQRGYQVYKEVCSACHSMNLIKYRNLQDVGFSEAEVKSIAAEYKITDGPNDDGEMFERSGRPSDAFKAPFANEKAARASNSGAYPPDLSLIVKARHDGANYVYSLLTGYEKAPADFHLAEGKYYNPYMSGGQIAMAPPLASDGQVSYKDDSVKQTVDQYAYDVVNFLQWAAEPEMEVRKQMGVKVLFFMAIFTILFYVAKCRTWARLKDEN